eukprot:7152952-Pyramimonas_sp.AAC.1
MPTLTVPTNLLWKATGRPPGCSRSPRPLASHPGTPPPLPRWSPPQWWGPLPLATRDYLRTLPSGGDRSSQSTLESEAA